MSYKKKSDFTPDVELSEDRLEALDRCMNYDMQELRVKYRLDEVTYSKVMTRVQIKNLFNYLTKEKGMEFETVDDVLYPDTLSSAAEILCRWMRPKEMAMLCKLVDANIQLQYHTGVIFVKQTIKKDFGSMVGHMGSNFNALTQDHDLMYIWMGGASKTRKAILFYGIDSMNIKNAMQSFIDQNGSDVLTDPVGIIMLNRSLEHGNAVMGPEEDFTHEDDSVVMCIELLSSSQSSKNNNRQARADGGDSCSATLPQTIEGVNKGKGPQNNLLKALAESIKNSFRYKSVRNTTGKTNITKSQTNVNLEVPRLNSQTDFPSLPSQKNKLNRDKYNENKRRFYNDDRLHNNHGFVPQDARGYNGSRIYRKK